MMKQKRTLSMGKKLLLLTVILCSVVYSKPTMSQKSYDALMNAQKLIEENKMEEAKKILDKILTKNNSYSKSYAYQYLSNIALGDGDYKKVATYYKKIIELSSFEKENLDRIKQSLSRIYLSLERYDEAINLSLELLKDSKISKLEIYENLVYSYYYLKNYKKSIEFSTKYNKISKKKKEVIYQLLYSSNIELKKHLQAIATLEVMIKEWSEKDNYWLQLISLYQETKQYKKALSTLELAYKEDILDPNKHTMFYANLLLQNKLYKKGSLVLEDGIKKGYIKEEQSIFELLIASYLNAKEYDKAIQSLESSKFAKTKKLKRILANLYYERHDYKNTIKVLKKAENKNMMEDGNLCILLALSYYELENTKACKEHLKMAIRDKKAKKRAMRIAKSLRINLTNTL